MTDTAANAIPFDVGRATIVVSTEEEAAAARTAFKQRVVVHRAIPVGGLEGPVLLLARESALPLLCELIEAGADRNAARFYELGTQQPSLSALIRANPNFIDAISGSLGHCLWDKVRPLHMWNTDDNLDVVDSGDTALGDHLKWRFPSLVVSCGGYGSGKSTIAQILAFKLLSSPEGIARNLRMSLCAFEDHRGEIRNRIMQFGTGGRIGPGDDLTQGLELEKRVHWFEPAALDSKGIAKYIEHITFLSRSVGVRVHMFDPWNNHDTELAFGEKHHEYVRRMMAMLRDAAQTLGDIIHVVAHIPKSAMSEPGELKPIRLKDASGAAEFANFADHGLCIARTSVPAAILRGEIKSEHVNKAILEDARKRFPPARFDEHAIISVDKVKIEGPMGKRGVFAFGIDKAANNIVIDSAATLVVRQLWRL